MPYATITEADHTLDLFDQVDALVPREPEGLLLLVRGRTERGVAVVSVWRSRRTRTASSPNTSHRRSPRWWATRSRRR